VSRATSRIAAALLAGLLAAPVPAPAQTTLGGMPAIYDIVPRDQPLLARDWPSATGHVVGEFPAGTEAVEVILAEPSLGWAMVNTGPRTGWLRLADLRRRPGQWQDNELPANVSCTGVAPEWRLALSDDAARLTGEGEPERRYTPMTTRTALGRGDRWSLGDAEGRLTAVIARGVCSDGVTRRQYGLSADVILHPQAEGAEAVHLAGCCTLLP
jgi:uncharacterized membrane protein